MYWILKAVGGATDVLVIPASIGMWLFFNNISFKSSVRRKPKSLLDFFYIFNWLLVRWMLMRLLKRLIQQARSKISSWRWINQRRCVFPERWGTGDRPSGSQAGAFSSYLAIFAYMQKMEPFKLALCCSLLLLLVLPACWTFFFSKEKTTIKIFFYFLVRL